VIQAQGNFRYRGSIGLEMFCWATNVSLTASLHLEDYPWN